LLGELAFHAVHVCGGEVALVDGDDDGLAGLLGVLDGLGGLRHDAIVGGHDDDDDVRDVRAAGAHVGEDGVAGSIEEGDFLLLMDDLIGSDVLGDATGLAGDDLGLAEEVEDGGLAVVHVSHDGDDGRAVLEQVLRLFDGGFGFLDDFLDLVETLFLVALFTLEGETVEFADFRGDVGFQRLVRRREDAEFDEIGGDVEGLETHAARQIRNHDRGLDDDQFGIVRSKFLGLGLGGSAGGHGFRSGNFRLGSSGRRLFIQNLGNGTDDRIWSHLGFADLGFLLLGEQIEGLALGDVELARCRRSHFGVFALALTA
jgi:hypothetical protein